MPVLNPGKLLGKTIADVSTENLTKRQTGTAAICGLQSLMFTDGSWIWLRGENTDCGVLSSGRMHEVCASLARDWDESDWETNDPIDFRSECLGLPLLKRKVRCLMPSELRALQPFLAIELHEHHIPWSRATFGDGKRTGGIIKHIRKELEEIESNPTDVTEWIDVAILALDGAWRSGHSAQEVVDALYAKLRVIRTRTYPKPTSEDDPSEHNRDCEPCRLGEEARG